MKQSNRRRRALAETRLLGKPFAQAIFRLVLWNYAFSVGGLQSVAHFLKYIKVILNIFERAIVREFSEQLLHLFFRGTHVVIITNYRKQRIQNPSGCNGRGCVPSKNQLAPTRRR